MPDAFPIVVAGAGAIGRTVAYVLARAGYRVTVVDPDPRDGARASRIAAGMLAPAFEALFDQAPLALSRAALRLWPSLADEIGLPIASEGAMAPGDKAQAMAWLAQLETLGARAELRDLGDGRWAAFSDEDRQIDPELALRLLREAAERLGARYLAGRVAGFAAGQARLAGGEAVAAQRLIVATGAERGLVDIAPRLQVLQPIKGHVLRTPEAFAGLPIIRGPGVYLCRTPWGTILGATMEPGVADEAVDPRQVEALLERGGALAGGLRRLTWTAAAGVRAATPDGLPLVGEGRLRDVILAVGARRNGWLLAPMIAEVVLDAVAGRPRGAAARRFDPARFD